MSTQPGPMLRPTPTTVAPVALQEQPQRVGRIVAVTGAHAVILIDPETKQLSGEREKSPEIGTLLKVDTAKSVSLAMVSALSSPMPSHSPDERELRIVEVEFMGELPKDQRGIPAGFRRGISCYPSLGDTVYRANKTELGMAYAADTETAIRVGHITQDSSIPAMIKIDEMLGKHFAVLGTTGTGKSCTVALILRRILEKNPQAHILLLDVHREYAQSFKELAEVISPDNMNLPFWLLNFDEAVEILIGQQPNRETDVEVLRELIPMAKQRYMNNARRDRGQQRVGGMIENIPVGVDTPVPYRVSDLTGVLDEYIGKLELRGELAPYKRLKARLETISRDPRYAFMFGSLTVQDTMAQVLARLFRVPVNGKPIAILELGGLPGEIINVVVSVLARLAFDFAVWGGGRIPITFVCEEAHRYVPIDRTLGFEPTKRAISRIAKEGRKYGVSLCMVTQRPAELDPTILSQCNTIFSMRLTNERDQDILRAGISDAAASLMTFMPTMGTGEAVTFGEGVALPTRIKFDMLPADSLPRSNTASFTKNWAMDLPDDSFLHEVVGRWRAQSHNPDGLGYAVEAAPAPAPQSMPPQPQPIYTAAPAPQPQPSLRRTIPQGNSGFGQSPQPAPVQQPPAASGTTSNQQSLASLIRQFRN
ncbi:ATP-binding protein [Aestuariivirga sp.]|uniref:ATP-binding protein n=1 Tax=Aestuariivirga sp. TaxID=2650926 RepID=UPI0039E44801